MGTLISDLVRGFMRASALNCSLLQDASLEQDISEVLIDGIMLSSHRGLPASWAFRPDERK